MTFGQAEAMAEFYYSSPIGAMRLELAEDRLTALHFCGQMRARKPQEHNYAALVVAGWLDAYFAGNKPNPASLPLDFMGTRFQLAVWQKLLALPYGQTITYGALASELGSGARAIGGAVGANPVCIVVPCHRVIAASGKLGGYGEGPERKIWLLRHEGCAGF